MNLPTLPTDNLYKFMAIAGLALAGYCAFFAYQQVWELKLQILRTEIEEKVVDGELTILNKNLDRLIARKKITDSEWHDVSERAIAVLAKKTKIEGKKRENELLNEQLWNHYVILWMGIIGGSLMAGLGFRFWYVRLQKPSELLMNMLISEYQDKELTEEGQKQE